MPPLGTANIALPCNKCDGCKQARANTWARRCEHEASLYQSNTFLTLTYDDDHLPSKAYLRPEDLTNFHKRIRAHVNRSCRGVNSDRSRPLRFFACGEYGDRGGRPHYHTLLFNVGFNDAKQVGADLYESETLNKLWPLGQARFGPATPAAANYIAKYTMKNQRPSRSADPRRENDADEDGEYIERPFLRASQGIGAGWLQKYHRDLVRGYLVTSEGQKTTIPRYYKNRLKDGGEKTTPSASPPEGLANNQYKETYELLTYYQRRKQQEPQERLDDAEKIHKRLIQLRGDKKL